MRRLLKTLALPPLSCFLLAGLGWLARRRRRRLGNVLIGAAVVLLWLFSTPLVAYLMIASLQGEPALDPAALPPGAGAIVVLSADMDRDGREFGGHTIGHMTLQRVRYGAWLHRRTGLPLLVSGGAPLGIRPTHGAAMKRALEDEFGATVRWVEDRSVNTWQNASMSAEILEREGIDRVLLVTHAWHMPRARDAFEAAGLGVVPAPTAFANLPTHPVLQLLPSPGAMRTASFALHEWLGRIWYAATGDFGS